MGRIEVDQIKNLSREEFRVLIAVEMGMKNHELVPENIVTQIANLKHGGVYKVLSRLVQMKLVSYESGHKYNGYRLTWSGYDFLALRTLSNKVGPDSEPIITRFGSKIGVGKESDIYNVTNENGDPLVIKIHRLGRTSFRHGVTQKRDYIRARHGASWIYLSRLSALKEFAFLKVLGQNNFPVPKVLDSNRHTVVMELIDGFPLQQVYEVPDVSALYEQLMELIVRLAQYGLIHGDFNEFNIMIKTKDSSPILIDFPQMVSTSHRNAEWYFDRDVNCIRNFFKKRFGYECDEYPVFKDIVRKYALDVKSQASGFIKDKQELKDMFGSVLLDPKDESENEDQTEEESSTDSDTEDENNTIDSTKESNRSEEDTCKVISSNDEEKNVLQSSPENSDITEEKSLDLKDVEKISSLQLADSKSNISKEDDDLLSESSKDSEKEESSHNLSSGLGNKAQKEMKQRVKKQLDRKKKEKRRRKMKGEASKKQRSKRDAYNNVKDHFR